jgi:hypothetical protein
MKAAIIENFKYGEVYQSSIKLIIINEIQIRDLPNNKGYYICMSNESNHYKVYETTNYREAVQIALLLIDLSDKGKTIKINKQHKDCFLSLNNLQYTVNNL